MGLMFYKPLDGSDPIPIARGAQGNQGPRGYPGDKGDTGPQGPPGEVSKAYVDQQDALKVNKAGDTMTGALRITANGGDQRLAPITDHMRLLTGDGSAYANMALASPTAAEHAATKGYVDDRSWDGTRAEYDALGTYDPTVTYYVREN